MGELVDRDVEHLNLLKWAYYLLATVTGMFSLFALIWIAIGGAAVLGALDRRHAQGPQAQTMGVIFLAMGAALLIAGLVMALCLFLAARSLHQRRGRVFCLVMAALCCLSLPWGTAIGVCTFIVLNRPSVKALFEPRGSPVTPGAV